VATLAGDLAARLSDDAIVVFDALARRAPRATSTAELNDFLDVSADLAATLDELAAAIDERSSSCQKVSCWRVY
jgi:hypothetical protein